MSRFASCSEMPHPFMRVARRAALTLGLGLTARVVDAQPVQPQPLVVARSVSVPPITSPVGPSPASGALEAVAPSVRAPEALHPYRAHAHRDDRTFGEVSPWYAPPLSALVPGLGQGLLRQQRGVVYLAAEGYLILRALGAQRDARRERDAYREIARTVARSGFGVDRPDAEWEYYERLQHILESGAFNQTPGAALTPETDPATFNGSIWRLARETFWRDPEVAPEASSPEYQRALAFYERRAVGEAFRWSWRDAQLEQDLYRQTIDRSNDASRQARQMIGLLLANHALSLVDAYVTVRLRVFGETDGAARRVGVAGQLPLPSPFR
jgi:hypothetical protein